MDSFKQNVPQEYINYCEQLLSYRNVGLGVGAVLLILLILVCCCCSSSSAAYYYYYNYMKQNKAKTTKP